MGGNSPSDLIHRMLASIFNDNVASEFSLRGKKHGATAKESLEKLNGLHSAICCKYVYVVKCCYSDLIFGLQF